MQASERKESKAQTSKGKKPKGLMGLLCDPKDEAGREENLGFRESVG